MRGTRILASVMGAVAFTFMAAGCSTTAKANYPAGAKTSLAKINMSSWSYNAEDDVYYQTGISYAATPADTKYETLGLYVPGAYFDGTENPDGTYTVAVNKKNKAGAFSASNAPFVMPIQTPGYAALEPPSGYVKNAAEYTKEGFIFVYAGARGRDHGAPAGVTDFKAAVRYVRYNADLLPGDTERVFTYGMSGGGAQSALMGATGDAPEYEPYLQAIGAVMGVSDAVMGSMDWCPITNLNVADAAYEWELGVVRTDLDADTKKLSDGLSIEFAKYINSLGLKDEKGRVLALEQSEDGLCHAGSYYDYLKSVIENSLNEFLRVTVFPYSPEAQKAALGSNMIMGEGGMMRGPMGMRPGANAPAIEAMDGVNRGGARSSGVTLSGTYNTVEEYIKALNGKESWVSYDKSTNTAAITSVEAFMRNVKQLQKSVGAFDDLNKNQGENTLFGLGDGKGAHFDEIMAELLSGTAKGTEYNVDLAKKDALGNTVAVRVGMYNPMYYLSPAYKGYRTAKVAKHWRIHAGIFQGDTAVSTELAYYLALVNYGKEVKSTEFADVWGLAHNEAELTGTSTENFIAWVKACLK